MNRLIILGNGFDLAHGLKTRYSDFILDLLKNELIESLDHSDYDDDTEVRTYLKESIQIVRKGNWRIDEAVKRKANSISNFDEWHQFLKEFDISINSITSISIFQETYKKINTLNWADIEAIYYDLLIGLIRNNKFRKLDPSILKKVIALNQELDFFKNRLVEYLERVEKETNIKCSGSHFWEKIKRKNNISDFPQEVHILNFNYTNTIQSYGSHKDAFGDSESRVYVNHIHGNLREKASIIFGYGDEVDSNYKLIEDLEENDLLEHVKSFGYFKNDSYKNLLGFLEGGPFEIWIVGHSCGLSDRVMLKKIFEHPDCESIRIVHYARGESNDHTEKTYQISRHFTNKDLMRKRIEIYSNENCIDYLIG